MTQQKSSLVRIAHWFFWLLVALLVLFAVAYIVVQQPKIQTFLVQQATTQLKQQLGSTTHVERVDISFFKKIILEEVYVEDQQQDTLLYAQRISSDISLFSLWDKTIHFEDLTIEDAVVNTYRNASDTLFNYDCLLKNLETGQSTDTAATTTAWDFTIQNIYLNRIRFIQKDKGKESELAIHANECTITVHQLDLAAKIVDLERIELNDSKIQLFYPALDTLVSKSTVTDLLEFPTSPWKIKAATMQGKRNAFSYQVKNQPVSLDKVNYKNLDINSFNFQINNYKWSGKNMEGELAGISFKEQSGFTLQNLKGTIKVDSTQIVVDELVATTPSSHIENSTQLMYRRFGDLQEFSDKVKVESIFENTKFAFQDIHWLATDWLPFLNTTLNETLSLRGQFLGTVNDLTANNLQLRVGERFQLIGEVAFQNITTIEQLGVEVDIENVSTSYASLQDILKEISLPVRLKDFGEIRVTTKARGDWKLLHIDTISVHTNMTTQLQAKGQMQHLDQLEQLNFDLDIANFQTLAQDWKNFLKGSISPELDSLGEVQYVGRFSGNQQQYTITGLLQSKLGALESDVELFLNNTFTSRGNYKGDLVLKEFDLGRFLNNPDIGKVSLSVKGQGSGLQVDSLEGDLQTTIAAISYKDYIYQDIKVDGRVNQQRFQGTVHSEDQAASFDFEGLVDLDDPLPDFRFKLTVDTLDLQALNWTTKPLTLSGLTRMNFRGSHPDELNGNIGIYDLHLADDSLHFHTDTLTLLARQLNTRNKNITVLSDFLTANIKGDFRLTELPSLVNLYLQEHFPLDWFNYAILIDTTKQLDLQTKNVAIKARVEELTPFAILDLLPVIELGTASLDATYESTKKTLQITGNIDEVQYRDLTIVDCQLETKGDANQVNTTVVLQDVQTNVLNLPLVEVTSQLINDSLYLDLLLQRDSLHKILAFNAWMNKPDEQFRVSLLSPLILNNEVWDLPPQNSIYWKGQQVFLEQFQLQQDSQQLIIQSMGTRFDSVLSPLAIQFQDFPIGELFALANKPDDFLEGHLNGVFTLKDFLKELHFEADLVVADMVLQEQAVGDLQILATEPPNADEIEVALDLKGQNNIGSAIGTVHTKDGHLDIQTNIQQLELPLLDPFMEGLVGKSEGFISGELQVGGTIGAPDWRGTLTLDSVSTLIDVTQTRYYLNNQIVDFNNKEIDLGQLQLQDAQQHQAVLSGKIYHQSFTDYLLDLNIQTSEFQFLNTTALDNELFYGTLLLSADVQVEGELQTPTVTVNARTEPGSVFYLSPFTELEVLTQNDYVIFASPDSLQQLSAASYQIKNTFPFDVTLNLELTDAGALQFIVDPISGDRLICRGNSDLVIQMKPSGLMEIFGNYIVSSGQYSFSYNQLVKRKFDIQPGGAVLFNGDPLNAKFDIAANYNTRSTTYELIKNEANLSDTERTDAQKKTDVQVQLLLEGDLETPEIKFDITLPENTTGSITDISNQKLQQLRANPDELNNQVFGLLLVNSFIVSNSSSASLLTSTGEAVALSSVSKLFTGQLNKLADQYIKGVEVNFDIDSYRKGGYTTPNQSNITELGIGLSKQLFNDRLTLKATGTVDLENNNQSTDFTSIAGDFLLEYKLTENGNYLIRAFRRSNFDVFTSENTEKNGFSIFLKQSFDDRTKKKRKK